MICDSQYWIKKINRQKRAILPTEEKIIKGHLFLTPFAKKRSRTKGSRQRASPGLLFQTRSQRSHEQIAEIGIAGPPGLGIPLTRARDFFFASPPTALASGFAGITNFLRADGETGRASANNELVVRCVAALPVQRKSACRAHRQLVVRNVQGRFRAAVRLAAHGYLCAPLQRHDSRHDQRKFTTESASSRQPPKQREKIWFQNFINFILFLFNFLFYGRDNLGKYRKLFWDRRFHCIPYPLKITTGCDETKGGGKGVGRLILLRVNANCEAESPRYCGR